MKKTSMALASFGMLLILSALTLVFSASVAKAGEVGVNASSRLCERFSSLSRIFPSCQEPEPTPTPPPPAPQPPPPTPPPAPPPAPDDERGHNLCKRYISSRIPIPQSCDVCPNVPGVQLDEPCADKACTDDGGTWEDVSCVFPPPDVCPNVPGIQESGPCADEQCVVDGGTWNGESCDFPPPPIDVCPNVPGLQEGGPCADEECIDSGGTWDGALCIFPPPPPIDVCSSVPGNQESGPCADEICEGDGGTWNGLSCDFPSPPPPVDACPDMPGHQESGPCSSTGTLPPPECSDGIDNDNDGKVDFPEDPECTSETDTNESDVVVAPHGSVDAIPVSVPDTVYPENQVWGKFSVIVANEQVTLGPVAFDATTTGMDQTSGLIDFRIAGEDGSIVAGPQAVIFVNGSGTLQFTGPILLPLGTSTFTVLASIPANEQWKVEDGATVMMSANPAADWTVMGQSSGVSYLPTSILPFSMGTITILVPACSDNQDNDGDGKKDFPLDPGCADFHDDDETDISGGGGGAGPAPTGGSSSGGGSSN